MNKIHGVKTYQKYIEMGITMTTLKEDLIALGIDYNKALERFLGKPDFYQEFLYLLVSTPDQKKLIFLYPQISLPIIPAIAVY